MTCRNLLLLTLAVLVGSLVWLVLQIPAAIDRRADAAGAKLDAYAQAVGKRLDARDQQVAAVLADVQTYSRMATADARANTDTVAVILRDVAEMTNTINRKILPDVTSLLAAVRESLSIVDAMKADLAQLTASTDADLKALKPALDNLAALLASLDQAVKTNSPKVGEISDSLARAIADLDATVANPTVASTVAHIEGISASTDVIMKRLATRAGKLKTILATILGAIKVNIMAPGIF